MNWYERQLIWFSFNWNYFFSIYEYKTSLECAGAHQKLSSLVAMQSSVNVVVCEIMKMKCSLSGSSETLEIGDMGTWESWALWVDKQKPLKPSRRQMKMHNIWLKYNLWPWRSLKRPLPSTIHRFRCCFCTHHITHNKTGCDSRDEKGLEILIMNPGFFATEMSS